MARSAESVHAVIKAYDVRGVVGEHIDAAFVQDVGGAFARLVREDGATKVVIGYDMRASSPDLARAFADGVTAQGLDVVLIGLASTDQLYFASGLFDCPGAMFTASHNPAKYNGIKLCRAGAKPVGQETGLATIAAEVVDGVPAFDGAPGTSSSDTVPGAPSNAGTPSTTSAAIVERPVSCPTGFAPARHSLMPLYFAGLWLAVNIAPGQSNSPDAKYS